MTDPPEAATLFTSTEAIRPSGSSNRCEGSAWIVHDSTSCDAAVAGIRASDNAPIAGNQFEIDMVM
jgi:hypothetical protein